MAPATARARAAIARIAQLLRTARAGARRLAGCARRGDSEWEMSETITSRAEPDFVTSTSKESTRPARSTPAEDSALTAVPIASHGNSASMIMWLSDFSRAIARKAMGSESNFTRTSRLPPRSSGVAATVEAPADGDSAGPRASPAISRNGTLYLTTPTGRRIHRCQHTRGGRLRHWLYSSEMTCLDGMRADFQPQWFRWSIRCGRACYLAHPATGEVCHSWLAKCALRERRRPTGVSALRCLVG